MLTGQHDVINTAAAELIDALKTIINVLNKWLRTKFRGKVMTLLQLKILILIKNLLNHIKYIVLIGIS